MTDLDLLTRLADEFPCGAVSAKAERQLKAAIAAEAGLARGSRPARPGRPWQAPGFRLGSWPAGRVATAAGLSLALAAGVLAAVLLPGSARDQHRAVSGSAAGRPLTATELAFRAAAAARLQPALSAGQWLYTRERSTFAWGALTFWRTAGAAYQSTWCYQAPAGKYPRPVRHQRRHRCVEPIVELAQLQGGQLVRSQWISSGPVRAFGSGLPGSLPADPQALLRYLAAREHVSGEYLFQPPAPGVAGATLVLPAHLTRSEREFNAIGWLLDTYVMSPARTAELYTALGEIPGVRVHRHYPDIAGRRGVAFTIGASGVRLAIILNPRDYRFDGVTWVGPGSQRAGMAIMAQVPVSGPGVRP